MKLKEKLLYILIHILLGINLLVLVACSIFMMILSALQETDTLEFNYAMFLALILSIIFYGLLKIKEKIENKWSENE